MDASCPARPLFPLFSANVSQAWTSGGALCPAPAGLPPGQPASSEASREAMTHSI